MTARTRERGVIHDPPENPNWVYWDALVKYRKRKYNGAVEINYEHDFSGVRSGVSHSSTISDVIGRPNRFNSCTHDHYNPITVRVPSKGPEAVNPYPSGSWRTDQIEIVGGSFQYSVETQLANDWPDHDTSIDWYGLVDDVGKQLDGRMKSKSNILVTTFEAAKTIAMLKNPFKALRALKVNKLLKSKDTLNALASTHLEFKYGFQQLYRDIVNFSTVYYQVQDHIRYLQDHVNRERKVHSRQVDDGAPGWESSETQFYLTLSMFMTNLKRTAVFSCNQVMPSGVYEITEMQHYLDALGTNKIIEALWDIVPFSFVVDWFIHFGRLATMNPYFWSSHKLTRLGYSLTHEWEMQAATQFDMPFWDGAHFTSSWSGQPQVVRKLYQRYPGFPPGGSGAGLFSSLSLTNLADAGALIVQRL